MNHEKRWEKIEEIGQGGQGVVYRVRDKQQIDVSQQCQVAIEAIRTVSSRATSGGIPKKSEDDRKRALIALQSSLHSIQQADDPVNHGALKVLHAPEQSRDADRSAGRIEREMKAMSESQHPNLLRILDMDDDAQWFVSEFHPRGTLSECLESFRGRVASALEAFGPLVAGVAELHRARIVHRDIKPDNIFLSARNELILGDFGLAFFSDDQRTRLSATLDNVGSRDWMPQWAVGRRIENISPSFDIYSLGKVLWSMISGERFLHLWYFSKPEYNLVSKFPDDVNMEAVNDLLGKCIVEDEDDCLPDADALRREIEAVLHVLEGKATKLPGKLPRPCLVCRSGRYELIPESGARQVRVEVNAPTSLRTCICNKCGHVQLFYWGHGEIPKIWSENP